MNKHFLFVIALGTSAVCFSSCGENNNKKKADGEPIVLGDPATIITETDSNHLTDLVVDLQPDNTADTTTSAVPVDTTKRADTVAAKPATPSPAKVEGLTIDFGDISVVIPGVSAKGVGNKDLKNATGATYQLTDGKLSGNSLRVSGGTISTVSQRYQSVVRIKNNLGTLELDDLGTTTSWKSIKGSNGTYPVASIDENNLSTDRINAVTLRNAVRKEARKQRMNKKTQLQWENSIKSFRSVKQKPV
ncbi:MAG: hypothetical protein JNL72_10740, partial [Flavipsychrobacter sp.]|nr:hypothetical protein [Flavipsychrobacter sp.]